MIRAASAIVTGQVHRLRARTVLCHFLVVLLISEELIEKLIILRCCQSTFLPLCSTRLVQHPKRLGQGALEGLKPKARPILHDAGVGLWV